MKHIAILCCGVLAVAGYAQSETPLTLEQALSAARANSPALRAAELQRQAAEKFAHAAGLWSNPTLQFEAEGMGGDLDPCREAEYTLGIKQDFLRGGKLDAERRIAGHAAGIATYASAEQNLELAEQVRHAFIQLLAQQEIGKVRAEQLELGKAFVEVARRRFNAGAGSELEVVQAELALEETVLSQTCCFGDLAAARARLASLIGMPVDELPVLAGSYYEIGSIDNLKVDSGYPSLMRLEAAASRVLAEAERARSQDVSDITLGAGYRHDAVDDLGTFVFSAAMPLNFNRRGRATHVAGLLAADAVRAEREEMFRMLWQELNTLVELHNGSVMEATLTRDKLLPKAEQAYVISREGYEAGRYSWVELIAAQQHLAEVRIRYIEAMLSVHGIEAELSKFMKKGN